eukprot:1633932-Prymnesium_polylepis.1
MCTPHAPSASRQPYAESTHPAAATPDRQTLGPCSAPRAIVLLKAPEPGRGLQRQHSGDGQADREMWWTCGIWADSRPLATSRENIVAQHANHEDITPTATPQCVAELAMSSLAPFRRPRQTPPFWR